MLSPKRSKYRKQHKGRIHGNAKGGFTLNFGTYGLKALQPERITARQLESARRAITRAMKRAGRVWIRIFPDVPVSSKPAEVRMGSGKGTPEFWVARVAPGRIMFEIDGVSAELAKEALTLGAAKLPIKAKFITRIGIPEMAKAALHKIGDIRAKTPDELAALLLELRKEQFNLRFQRATGQNEGLGRVKQARREIARVKTVQGQHTRDAAKTASHS